MPSLFEQFLQIHESDDASESPKKDKDKGSDAGIGTKVSLGDGNEFEPFEVSDDPKSQHYGKNKNLAPLVRAFKDGANWGWSKDDAGSDKPVKISGKKLYLAGGAVRDHLVGKKARNVELATNASPDEVYHLLKQNGFDFVKEDGESPAKPNPNKKESAHYSFWVKKANKNGRPFVFGIRVNEDEYELEVFTKSPKGDVPNDPESGSHADDAAGRDFTINGMYVLLSNDNGPNKELNDFHGGLHHLANKRVQPIGDMSKKFKEDPSRLMRYVRMMAMYGDPKKVPMEEKEVVSKHAGGLQKLDRKKMMDEFKRGLSKDDLDPRSYLKLFNDFGMTDHLFPGQMIDKNLPKELSELGDKHMPLAWMLRMNDPSSLESLGLDPADARKTGFLSKLLNLKGDIGSDGLSDLVTGFMTSGVSSRKVKDFATKLGGLDSGLIDAFIQHAKAPRVKTFKMGENTVMEGFADVIDPFTNKGDSAIIERRRRDIEHTRFQKLLESK